MGGIKFTWDFVRNLSISHYLEYCTSGGKFDNLKIQLTESVNVFGNLLGQKLWQFEEHWQGQLFTLSHGLNSPFGLVLP